MRAAAIVLALVLATDASAQPRIGAASAGGGGGVDLEPRYVSHCNIAGDYLGPYIEQPQQKCCSGSACPGASGETTYKQWTRECVAVFPGQPYIIAGAGTSETSLELSGTFKYDTNTCFANDAAGSQNINADNQKAWIADVREKAAEHHKPDPLIFLAIRNDVTDAYDIGTSDPDLTTSFDRNWLLETDRVWESTVATPGGTGVIDYFEAVNSASDFSGCRYPQSITSLTAGDKWDETAGCATLESFKTPYIMSHATLAAERQRKVYYVFFRDGATQQVFYPSGMKTDLTNPGFRAWLLRYIYLRMNRERADGWQNNDKLHQFFEAKASGEQREHWIDTNDGMGGVDDGTRGGVECSLSATTVPTTLTDARACGDLMTGPPEIAATDSDYPIGTAFTYPLYVEGLRDLTHEAYVHDPRLPSLIYVNPNWYKGCDSTWMVDADYDDASCDNHFDDPTTAGVNENALLRQRVQEAGYVLIDRADDTSNGTAERAVGSGGIGAGTGSGLSSVQLTAMIEGGTPAPLRVEVYDSQQALSVAPRIRNNPVQVNPEAALTIDDTAECANGVDDDADGDTDYPADSGCGSAAGTDETASASVACSDGVDNDSDGVTDYPADGGCSGTGDASEVAQCQDGSDNEVDGLTDYPADPDCTSANDNSEP